MEVFLPRIYIPQHCVISPNGRTRFDLPDEHRFTSPSNRSPYPSIV